MKRNFRQSVSAIACATLFLLAATAYAAEQPAAEVLPRGAFARLGTQRFRADNDIEKVVLSPDGKRIAVVQEDDDVLLLDAVTGQRVLRFECSSMERTETNPHHNQMSTFSGDGALFAVYHKPWLSLHDAATGKALALLARPETRRLYGIWFSGDGRWLYCAETDRDLPLLGDEVVTVIDVNRRCQVREIVLAAPVIQTLGIAPDGKTLALQPSEPGAQRPTVDGISLWHLETGKSLHALPETREAGSIAFAPDSKTLAMEHNSSILTLWDVATGKPRWRRVGVSGGAMAFSPDGKQLAVTVNRSTVAVYSLADGARLVLHRGPDMNIESLAVTADGNLVAAGSEGRIVRVWRPGQPPAAGGDSHHERVRQLAFDAHGERVYSADVASCLEWNLRTGHVRRCDNSERLKAMSPGERTVRLGELFNVAPSESGQETNISVWDLKTGRELWVHRCPFVWRWQSTALSPDSRFVALSSCLPNVEIRVWDVKADKELWRVESLKTWMDQLQFSPDGKLLLARAKDNTVWELWDVALGRRLHTLAMEQGECASAFVFARDSRNLYAAVQLAGGKGCIRCWDAGSGKPVTMFGDTDRPATALAFSPDGKTFAAGYEDTTILLWDLAGRNKAELSLPPMTLPLPAPPLPNPALTIPLPDSEPLPAGALHRLGTSQFRTDKTVLSAAAISANGKVLAVACCRTHVVRLLDAATGRQIDRFPNEARALAFSPDGALLGVGGRSQTTVYELRNASNSSTETNGRLWIDSLNFTADSRYYPMFDDDKLEIWDAQATKVVQSFEVPFEKGAGAALSGDGSVAACWAGQYVEPEGDKKHCVLLYDLKKKQALRKIATEGDALKATLSPDGKHLAVGESLDVNLPTIPGVSYCLSIWEVASGKLLHRTQTAQPIRWLGYSPDGKRLGVCYEEGRVELRDPGEGKILSRRYFPETNVWSLAFLPDGPVRVVCSRGQLVYAADVETGRVPDALAGPQAAADELQFSREGRTLSAFSEGSRRDWNVADGKHLAVQYADSPRSEYREEMSFEFFSRNLIVSGDHGLAAALQVERGSEKHPTKLCIWQRRTGRVTYFGAEGDANVDAALALSGSGRTAAVATTRLKDLEGFECVVVVRDTATGKKKTSFALNEPCRALLFSPDETLLAADNGRWKGVDVWYANGGVRSLTLPVSEMNDQLLLAFSPDGRTLAAGVHDADQDSNRVLVWELATGKVRREFTARSAVTALAFSPDGRLLASAQADTTILLWDVLGSAATTTKATPEQLQQWWMDLAAPDATKGLLAMRELAARPAQTTEWLTQKLPPARTAVTEADLKRLIADLDHDDFKRRDEASRRLRYAGPRVIGLIRAALELKPPPEQKRRLEELVEELKTCPPDPEVVRPTRALEVLERIGTPEAKQLLEELAKGAAEAQLTQDPKATLQRLAAPSESGK
jgi:WD40 repeat protein